MRQLYKVRSYLEFWNRNTTTDTENDIMIRIKTVEWNPYISYSGNQVMVFGGNKGLHIFLRFKFKFLQNNRISMTYQKYSIVPNASMICLT